MTRPIDDNFSKSALLVGAASPRAASRNVCAELADRLRTAGWNIVLTSRRAGRLARVADMILTTWIQRSNYRVAQVDVFSGNAFMWAEGVCGLLRRAGKPYVLTLHGGNLPVLAQDNAVRVAKLLQSAAAVTSPSAFLQRQMRAFRTDLRILPNAIDLEIYRARIRRNPAPRLIWLRAFHQIYNPSLAVRVLSSISDDYPAAQMFMIGADKGDGSLAESRQLAQELGVADRIEFPGRVAKADVPKWLDRGDIFLNTSSVDNSPVSVAEALGSGLCVVSTDAGGLRDLVEHETNALLTPSEDAAAMAQAVRRLLSSPDLAEQVSRGARARALQFDWSLVLPQWEGLLTQVQAS